MSTEGARQEAARFTRPALPAADPILATKVTVPDIPAWAVPRPRITRLVSQGARWYPLTVLTGPAGTGKTMALALWAAAEPRPVAWVGLDRYDNRPGVFWSYVVAALRRSGLATPEALPAVPRGRAADYTFLLRLASALAGQDQPVLLVLDDFHVLAEPKVLKGLDFVLRNSGAGLRLLISSRMDPLLRLHRYRLDGQLAEIRASDLAFDTGEAGLLLAQHRSRLPAATTASLTQRTEGWAAGLRLAAMSLETHPDPGPGQRGSRGRADRPGAGRGHPARAGPGQRVRALRRVGVLPLPHAAARGAPAQAAAQAPRAGSRPAPARGALVPAQRLAGRRGAARGSGQ
jgi:LuxR family transcriptional regulator, maltose regulon positive regulatory protein